MADEVAQDTQTQAPAQGAAPVAVDPTVSADLDQAVAEHEDVDGAEPVEGGEDAIQPPAALNAEGKAIFATLPKEAQQWWADTEKNRARQVTEATTKAAQRERDAITLHQRAEAEAKGRYAQQLMTYLASQQPREPDPSQYQDMNEYSRARAIYQHQANQFAAQVQQIQALGAEAQQGMHGLTEQQRQQDATRLRDSFPEWFDEAKGPQHVERLTAVGAELGYSPELMAQANADDILALRKVADLKEKADKWDKLQSTRMAQVRAGKGSVPPNARTAGLNGQAAPVSTAAAMYPNDVRR